MIQSFSLDRTQSLEAFVLPQLHLRPSPWLQSLETIEFTPGVNVLVGPNGSGKSTILRAMAKYFHLENTDNTSASYESLNDISYDVPARWGGSRRVLRSGVKILHDGGPVRRLDADWRPHADFTDDNMIEHLDTKHMYDRRSAGETSMFFVRQLTENRLKPAKPWRPWNHDSNEVWAQVTQFLAGNIEGPKTPVLLMDEPDRALSVAEQEAFWPEMCVLADDLKLQVIAVTHNPFALGLPGVNYIETAPDYIRTATDAYSRLTTRLTTTSN